VRNDLSRDLYTLRGGLALTRRAVGRIGRSQLTRSRFKDADPLFLVKRTTTTTVSTPACRIGLPSNSPCAAITCILTIGLTSSSIVHA